MQIRHDQPSDYERIVDRQLAAAHILRHGSGFQGEPSHEAARVGLKSLVDAGD